MPDQGLQVRGLNVAIDSGAAIVKQVDLDVAPGQIVALVGESGCGKSTLLRAVAGLLPRTARWTVQGEARWAGTALLGASAPQTAQVLGRRLGFVFQEAHEALNPTRSVQNQLQLAFRGLPRVQRGREVEQVLGRVGLSTLAARGRVYPHELSGGQRQRVLIAMAIAQQPELIVADEPTSHLDLTSQAQILNLLSEQTKRHQTAVLWVSHDLAMVSQIAAHIYVMYAGRVVEHGPTADVMGAPRHPYTAALIAALPAQGRLPSPIQGEVAEALSLAPGCAFHPRCAHSQAQCRSRRPGLQAEGPHRWACWHPRDPQLS